MTAPIVFLVDNGSLRAQATLALRALADALSARTDRRIEAVSLLHSHKVPAEQLNGVPATIVKRRLREWIELGHRDFVCLPLFLGPSLAISEYLPQVVAELQLEHPDLQVQVAAVLAGENWDAPDPRLAQILAEQVRALQLPADSKVALVDHGSPIIEVNQVRNAVARQLAQELELPSGGVLPCSMERRAGEAYAFNEPLLEHLGQVRDFVGGHLGLAMLFLLPGRHAGEDGDVSGICDGLVRDGVFEQVLTTPLLGEHPMLLDILEDRLRSVRP
ncbi:sirohydrochlorin chelatase [Coraliomargarita sp. W4R53]